MDSFIKFTGLFDKYGQPIKLNDLVLFRDNHDGCEWAGVVTFEDGVVTICSFQNVIQVKNPRNWNQKHNWVDSRSWACQVGYGEFGSWNVPRQSITRIANNFKTAEDYLAVKIRYNYDYSVIGQRVVNCHVVG